MGGDSTYQSESFYIDVACIDRCIYSLLVDSNGYPRRLMEGVPYKMSISKE